MLIVSATLPNIHKSPVIKATNTHDYDDDNGYGFEDALDEDADDVNRTANMAKDSAFRIFGTGDAVGEADEDDEEEDGDILTGSRLLPEPEEVVFIHLNLINIFII